MNNRIKTTITSLLAILLTLTPLYTTATNNPRTPEQQQKLNRHVQSLNELTERRTTNRLFNNEQPLTNGLNIGHINTSKGNVTFVMRDLVTINRLPIIFSRVYDTSRTTSGDFGSGWYLTFNEHIRNGTNSNLIYHDDSGSDIPLITDEQGFFVPLSAMSDIKQVVVINDKTIKLVFSSKISKTFVQMGQTYQLTTITTPFDQQIQLNYQQGKIIEIVNSNGQLISIKRNNNGYIKQISDNLQQTVIYHYQDQQLSRVTDIGGQDWQFKYNVKGLLKKILDPTGRKVAAFNYYRNNKAKRSIIRQQNLRFEYSNKSDQTTIKDALNHTTTLTHNNQGIVVQTLNSLGQTSKIKLNEHNQVTALYHNNVLKSSITYNDKHQATSLTRNDQTFNIHYQNNEIVNIGKATTQLNQLGLHTLLSADGITRHYRYNTQGDLTQEQQENHNTTYSYNAQGLLTAMSRKVVNNQNETASLKEQASFEYNPKGRLSKITFPNDEHHNYQYNQQGFRSQTLRSDGSKINYQYDAAGNLLTLTHTLANGQSQLKQMQQNPQQQTEQFIIDGNMALDVTYNQIGNPIRIAYNGRPVEYHYDKLGRLNKVVESDEVLTYNYQIGEKGLREQQDKRSFISQLSKGRVSNNAIHLNRLYTRTTGTPHRFVFYDKHLGQFNLPAVAQIIATDINHDASQRRRLYNAFATDKTNQHNFDKPSNSHFIPSIYAAINCEADSCSDMLEVMLTGPSTVTMGQMTSFNATAIISPFNDGSDICVPQYRFSVNGNVIEYNSTGLFNYSFTNNGDQTVQVRANCRYCPSWHYQYDGLTINAVCPEGGCLDVSTTTVVKSTLPNSRRILGVGEVVDLQSTFDADWEIISGGGRLEATRGRKVGYQAQETAGKVKIKVTLGEESKIIEFDVITPSNAIMVRKPNSQLNHHYGIPGVGWKGKIYLLPDTVAFHHVNIYEPYDPTVGFVTTGFFNYQAGETHLPGGAVGVNGNIWNAQDTVIKNYGTPLGGEDWVQGGGRIVNSYYQGTAYWDIPWHYFITEGNDKSYHLFTLRQLKVIDSTGKVTVSKGGHSESANLYAPTTSW